MTPPTPENKIYVTAKARMTAEAKIRRNALIMHVLFGWYSFCLIVLSLGDLTQSYRIPHSGFLSLALSIGLFAMSFYIYGEKYHERADKFRSCYLKLQELYNSNAATNRKMSDYAKILDQYDNHLNSDYDDMLFNAWLRNQNLQNAQGPLKISFSAGVMVVIRRVVKFVLLAALFAAPVLVAARFAEPAIVDCTVDDRGALPNGC